MTTFEMAIKHLNDVDLSFWDIEKTPEQQPDMQEIIKACYERFESDNDNVYSNETYRATVFEVALCHLIDLSNDRHSCFLIACQICSKYHYILNEPEYEIRGSYPKVMFDEWDKYCAQQINPPHYLVGELSSDIFSMAYEYTFNPEPPKIFIKAKKNILSVILFPYKSIISLALTIFWYICIFTIGAVETSVIFTKMLNTSEEVKSTLKLTTSILLWSLIILAIIHFV